MNQNHWWRPNGVKVGYGKGLLKCCFWYAYAQPQCDPSVYPVFSDHFIFAIVIAALFWDSLDLMKLKYLGLLIGGVYVHSEGNQEPAGCSQVCPHCQLLLFTKNSSPKCTVWEVVWMGGTPVTCHLPPATCLKSMLHTFWEHDSVLSQTRTKEASMAFLQDASFGAWCLKVHS